jgi:hypothetical protein
MAAAVVLQPPWCLTPGAAAYDNQPILWATVLYTMAAVVGHLGQDVSKDDVGCCDVCFAR